MGLSIARTIIEAHGGRIWAENQATGGAVFRLVLPLAKVFTKGSDFADRSMQSVAGNCQPRSYNLYWCRVDQSALRVCNKLFLRKSCVESSCAKLWFQSFLAVLLSASGAAAIELRSSDEPADHPFGRAKLPHPKA